MANDTQSQHRLLQHASDQQTMPSAAAYPRPPSHESDRLASVPPPQDVNDFLRKKRKAREHKACYPCRQRKVKCDLSRPCQTCRDRDHPELCSYHPPDKRRHADDGTAPHVDTVESSVVAGPPPATATLVTLATSPPIGRLEFDMLCRKLDGLENSIADLRRELGRQTHTRQPSRHDIDMAQSSARPSQSNVDGSWGTPAPLPARHTDLHGLHTKNDAGEYVHFGGGSIPALLYMISQGSSRQQQHLQGEAHDNDDHQTRLREALGKSILPLFGLDNELATYPFVDLWGLPHASRERAEQLAKALPDDAQLLNLWSSYRDLAYIIYPGVAEPEKFESKLQAFIQNRASCVDPSNAVTEQEVYGRDYRWLGLLFGILGAGAQCSPLPRMERELTSQVYVCCAFECLRFTNFLSQPHLESIQTLTVIGMVMTNNTNAGTAWSLLGLTIRLAQGLGLHQSCPSVTPREVVFPRSKVWWAIVMQDSLLSITYDRASSSASSSSNTMAMPQHFGDTIPYHKTMYRLCLAGLDIVRDRARITDIYEQFACIRAHSEVIATIMREAGDYLLDSRRCTTSIELIQHRGLHLHASYILSELYRPAINRSARGHELSRAYSQACIDNLSNTVDAWLRLKDVTSFALTSWQALHRALSSALLLGILGEHMRNERARRLMGRFISVMTDITDTVNPQEVSAPVHRGVAALRKLNVEEYREHQPSDRASMSSTVSIALGPIDSVPDALNTPSTSDGLSTDEDHSPYSVLNNILWGDKCGLLQSEMPLI